MDKDNFYDSLDEDDSAESPRKEKTKKIASMSPKKEEKDITEFIPLYTGEIDKTQISRLIRKKKVEKINKSIDFVLAHKAKKSYLAMYRQKMNKMATSNGTVTSRAICEVLSPRRDLSPDSPAHSQEEESDYDELITAGCLNLV